MTISAFHNMTPGSPGSRTWASAGRKRSPLGRFVRKNSRRCYSLLVFLFAVVACNVAAFAQEEPAAAENAPQQTGPLYEQEPYDIITLTPANKSQVLKVEPLDLPNRRLPANPRRTDKLKVRLWEDPETLYEIRWSAIEKIELFEDMILKKAMELSLQGDGDTAFEYFTYLETKDAELPGLKAAVEDYLYREAGVQQAKGQFRAALAMLDELHRRNPAYSRLENALGAATEKLVEQYVERKDYASARTLVAALAKRYPAHSAAAKWNERLRSEAETLLNASRQAFMAGDFRLADQTSRQIAAIWPDLSGADELIAEINKKYPRIVVGVSAPAEIDALTKLGGAAGGAICSGWAARRDGRLLQRTLTEFLGIGAEGGVYRCGVGEMKIAELDRGISFRIRPGIYWNQTAAGVQPVIEPQKAGELSGGDVSRRLLAMADPAEACYDAAWADLLAGVSTADVFRVQVDLTRPHVRPDAFMQTVLPPYTAGRLSPDTLNLSLGPYEVVSQEKNSTVFVLNKNYFAAEDGQPKEIVEQFFPDNREMVQALRDGRIKLIDRVNPWDLAKIRSIEGVTVQPYGLPLVHCLIPNMERPLAAQRTFRRALVYGINRQAILDHLLGGEKPSGCGLVSGPFLQGDSYDDPRGYAYDTTIAPRPYEPHLAIALAGVAVDVLAAAEAKKAAAAKEQSGEKKSPEEKTAQPEKQAEKKPNKPNAPLARIVLAHPPQDIARTVCVKIQQQLKPLGIEVTLRELEAGPLIRVPDDADLLYAELPMWEPIVDARRLLAQTGPARGASPYMELALRQLDLAADWREVRSKLREIHRIARNDVAVIPLWQMPDHFAVRRGLGSFGERPVVLYQNVEQWRLEAEKQSGKK